MEDSILIFGTRRSKFNQELYDRVLRDAGNADRRTDRIAFTEAADYLSTASDIKAVHTNHNA